MYYQCAECKLVYIDKAIAKRCEAWCHEHHSCNLDIIEHAIDHTDGFSSELPQDTEDRL